MSPVGTFWKLFLILLPSQPRLGSTSVGVTPSSPCPTGRLPSGRSLSPPSSNQVDTQLESHYSLVSEFSDSNKKPASMEMEEGTGNNVPEIQDDLAQADDLRINNGEEKGFEKKLQKTMIILDSDKD